MGWEGGKGQRRSPEALGMARIGCEADARGPQWLSSDWRGGAKRARVLGPSGKGGAGEQGGAPQAGRV